MNLALDADARSAIWLTLKLAAVTTALLLVIATPLAWWLYQTRSRAKAVTLALVNLPLVLPPTVLGFYLLILLGPHGWVGQVMMAMGFNHLAFTFSGLVIGSMIFSLPFAVQPVLNAFEAIGARPMEVAATLRARPLDAFWSVALPQARQGYVLAAVLTFAHTLGEFGVVLLIGGNIEGETRVVSTRILGYVEAMDYTQAHLLSALMVGFSFVVLLFMAHAKTRAARLLN